jgi:serine/threonine protein kinase
MAEEATRPLRRTFGPYSCIKVVGMSANNTVYYALHQGTGKLVALRALHVTHQNADAAIKACLAELEKFAQLDTPNIVPIEDYGSDGTVVYLVMRVMKNGSLQDRLKHRAHQAEVNHDIPLPSAGEVLAMLDRLAQALDDLHVRDMVHGQVEPRNILFDDMGQAYMADIGLTRLMKIIYSLDATNSFTMNRYSAPELWDGQRPMPATDQYSLACIAYELMTGRPPFDAPTIYGLMKQHNDDVALPPHYVRETLSPDLALPFWQALAKPTDKRFASVRAFVEELRVTLAGREGEPTGFFTFEVPSLS